MAQKERTMFKDEARSLYVVTGARGVGKTTFLATYNPPSQIKKVFWLDSENSANNIRGNLLARGLDFGYYNNIGARFTDLPDSEDLLNILDQGRLPWMEQEQKDALISYYLYIRETLRKDLTRGKYNTLVLDTLEAFEAGMAAYVEANSRDFGLPSKNPPYGGLWTKGVYPLYREILNGIWDRGVTTILLSSHLKNPWIDKKPVPGKVQPGGKSILYILSSMFVWLVNDTNNYDGAPAGLLLKERFSRFAPANDKDEWDTRRVLPYRIPHCTWKDIRNYAQNPANLKDPDPRELMSKDEQDMISPLLNSAQMQLMIISGQKEVEEMRQATNGMNNISAVSLSQDQDSDGDESSEEDDIVEKVYKYFKELGPVAAITLRNEFDEIKSLAMASDVLKKVNERIENE